MNEDLYLFVQQEVSASLKEHPALVPTWDLVEFIITTPSGERVFAFVKEDRVLEFTLSNTRDTSRTSACSIEVDEVALEEMALGELNPLTAVLMRKVKISGDRQALVELQPLMEGLKERLQPPMKAFLDKKRAGGLEVVFMSRYEWKGDTKKCMLCAARFNLMNRRHHCRVCGDCVCSQCSSYAIADKRLCVTCFHDKVISKSTKEPASTWSASSHTPESPPSPSSPAPEHPSLLMHKILTELHQEKMSQNIFSVLSSQPGLAPIVASARSTLMKLRSVEKQLSQSTSSTSLVMRVFPHASLVLGLVYLYTRCSSSWALMLLVASSKWYKHHLPALLLVYLSNKLPFFSQIAGFSVRKVLGLGVGVGIRLLHKSLGRQVHIYAAAAVMILGYTITRFVITKVLHLSDSQQARVYKTVDQTLAPFLTEQIMSLRSIFTKFGQALGSRADVIPPDWTPIMERLQDDMPVDSASYVEQAVEASFGHGLNDLFSEFDFDPLASASIAQVHMARLRRTGQKVAVKVQHEGMSDLMTSDMHAFRRILTVVAWLNPRFGIALQILDSWEEEMMKELDFTVEGKNLRRVRENLERSSMLESRVLVPKPIEGMVQPKVFCMEFIEGFKITDQPMLELYQVDKKALVETIVGSTACQLLEYGFFNADPHPGKLLLRGVTCF